MFKRCISLFLLLALMGSNLSNLLVYAGFEVNQKFIAKKLCVNRERPAMHCNGRCYLVRKLKAADENEKKEKDNSTRLEVNFFQPSFQFEFKQKYKEAESVTHPFAYHRDYNHPCLQTVYLPPEV
jgi:hypothetical protein